MRKLSDGEMVLVGLLILILGLCFDRVCYVVEALNAQAVLEEFRQHPERLPKDFEYKGTR